MSEPDGGSVRTIKTDFLARVEGEGAMFVRIRDGEVEDVRLRIYEPPRFFEAFLRGRSFLEAPDITSRICGICPMAYQTSAVLAMEDACGVVLDGQLRALRRLIYCGEWIESHALHVLLLHAPDFLGQPSGIELAQLAPELVERGLQLKKVGNSIVTVVGGREIHPINMRVGGFYRAPERSELETLREPLQRGLETALELTRWAAGFDFPDHERDYEFVSLRSDLDEYPIDRGVRLISSGGLDIPISAFTEHVVETHVPHSNALHASLRGRGNYLVGPNARFVLGSELLTPLARELAAEVGLDAAACRNPFRSIVVRCIEIAHACDEARQILDAYEPPDAPAVEVVPRAGVGHGASEAPRGTIYHRYEIDDEGTIQAATIVPPTSQNQATIEQDLRMVVEREHGLDDEALTLACEHSIRNYDPCISCATHFLRLEIDRG
jgi:coenzyme F420-reducing hydrogenase alpha subunit